MAIDIKQAHRRLIEETFGAGNYDLFDELCDPEYRAHDPLTGDANLMQDKERCRMYRAAFPDLRPTLLATYAEGNAVITQWRMAGTHTGKLLHIEPTGNRCAVEGITIGRFRAGLLVESWSQWDALGLMRQLGEESLRSVETARTQGPRPRA